MERGAEGIRRTANLSGKGSLETVAGHSAAAMWRAEAGQQCCAYRRFEKPNPFEQVAELLEVSDGNPAPVVR